MAKQTLAQIADELYGLAPAEFTAARNARAKDIKDTADASGRLVRPLEATGVETVDLTDAVAAPEASMMSAPRPQAKTAPVRDLAAVRAAKEAEKRADETDAAVRGLERDLEQRETARERLESRLADLEQQVATVENELRDTDRDLRTLGWDRDKAERRAADLRAEAEKLRSEN